MADWRGRIGRDIEIKRNPESPQRGRTGPRPREGSKRALCDTLNARELLMCDASKGDACGRVLACV